MRIAAEIVHHILGSAKRTFGVHYPAILVSGSHQLRNSTWIFEWRHLAVSSMPAVDYDTGQGRARIPFGPAFVCGCGRRNSKESHAIGRQVHVSCWRVAIEGQRSTGIGVENKTKCSHCAGSVQHEDIGMKFFV